MKDNNFVVLDEELVSPHTKEDRGTGVERTMTLLLSLPRLSQEVTRPMARRDVHHNGVSKRHSDSFDLPPVTACGGMGPFMG